MDAPLLIGISAAAALLIYLFRRNRPGVRGTGDSSGIGYYGDSGSNASSSDCSSHGGSCDGGGDGGGGGD